MDNKSTIHLAQDFSRFPGGRYRTDGPHSGEEFREEHLEPALRHHEHVSVVLDDVVGLPASFLEEAFGGLVRAGHLPKELERRLSVVAETPRLRRYPLLVGDFIRTAAQSRTRAVV